MKPSVSTEVKHQVLTLRRSHLLREVAQRVGIPIGTFKALYHRAGLFRDNSKLRELFTLPPIQASSSTELVVPELPPQECVTGDKEIYPVLWLRSVIKTGQANLIQKAMAAAKLVKTPLPELQKRYTKDLISKKPENWVAAMGSFGFADLEELAERSVKKLQLQTEAHARFGERLFVDTPAEEFCVDALAGLKRQRAFGDYDEGHADVRFQSRPDLLPNTLDDCLYELAYRSELYLLRASMDGGDARLEVNAREWFVFRCLARIRPKSTESAISVFRYLVDADRMGDRATDSILLNLTGQSSADGLSNPIHNDTTKEKY